MDALVMCGGRGTRLDAPVEKPLYELAGQPMVGHVCDALTASSVTEVYAAVSPHAPDTREYVREQTRCSVVETPGEGYVADLDAALADDRLEQPLLTCVADLPLLAPALVDEAITTAVQRDVESLTVAVPAALKEALGVSVDTTLSQAGRELAPVGVNIVGSGEGDTLVSYDARLAVNVNRAGDAAVATRLA